MWGEKQLCLPDEVEDDDDGVGEHHEEAVEEEKLVLHPRVMLSAHDVLNETESVPEVKKRTETPHTAFSTKKK